MPISLKKGQKVSITKDNPGLSKVVVGLGWDVNAFDTGGDFDLDAAAFLLTDTGKVAGQGDFVFFGNLTHASGGVQHMGDNRTGAGEKRLSAHNTASTFRLPQEKIPPPCRRALPSRLPDSIHNTPYPLSAGPWWFLRPAAFRPPSQSPAHCSCQIFRRASPPHKPAARSSLNESSLCR